MKALMVGLAAAFGLAGCVAVPYEPVPAAYYYGPPAPSVYFSYGYYGGGHAHRHHPRHRHW